MFSYVFFFMFFPYYVTKYSITYGLKLLRFVSVIYRLLNKEEVGIFIDIISAVRSEYVETSKEVKTDIETLKASPSLTRGDDDTVKQKLISERKKKTDELMELTGILQSLSVSLNVFKQIQEGYDTLPRYTIVSKLIAHLSSIEESLKTLMSKKDIIITRVSQEQKDENVVIITELLDSLNHIYKLFIYVVNFLALLRTYFPRYESYIKALELTLLNEFSPDPPTSTMRINHDLNVLKFFFSCTKSKQQSTAVTRGSVTGLTGRRPSIARSATMPTLLPVMNVTETKENVVAEPSEKMKETKEPEKEPPNLLRSVTLTEETKPQSSKYLFNILTRGGGPARGALGLLGRSKTEIENTKHS